MYTLQDVADRYGVTKVAALKYIKANIEFINKDEVNAYQTGPKKAWELTDKAIRILDGLRRQDVVIAVDPLKEEKIIQLMDENMRLKDSLMAAQAEIDRQKNRVIEMYEKAPVKELAAAKSELAAKDRELEIRNEQLDETKKEKRDAEAQISVEREAKEKALRSLVEKDGEISILTSQVDVERTGKEDALRQAEFNRQAKEKAERETENLKAELDRLNNRSFWQRLFGK